MMEHDDIKASVLQDLIEKLMEMKTGDDKPDMHADPMADHMAGAMGKPKMGLLAIAKPEGDDESDPQDEKDDALEALLGGKGEADEECEQDMKKPLGQNDFAMMKRKQMGL